MCVCVRVRVCVENAVLFEADTIVMAGPLQEALIPTHYSIFK